MARAIPDVRITPDSATVSANLGLLKDLGGTWRGKGFNLIARPDFQGDAPLYLQLNQTQETLTIDPIGSSIPNRGFGQDDIELFGLTYLQKISDTAPAARCTSSPASGSPSRRPRTRTSCRRPAARSSRGWLPSRMATPCWRRAGRRRSPARPR